MELDVATQQTLLLALTTLVTSVVLQLVKKFVSFVPNKWLPVIAPFLGALGASLSEVSTMTGVNVIVGALAGSAAVGFNQVPKQLAKPE